MDVKGYRKLVFIQLLPKVRASVVTMCGAYTLFTAGMDHSAPDTPLLFHISFANQLTGSVVSRRRLLFFHHVGHHVLCSFRRTHQHMTRVAAVFDRNLVAELLCRARPVFCLPHSEYTSGDRVQVLLLQQRSTHAAAYLKWDRTNCIQSRNTGRQSKSPSRRTITISNLFKGRLSSQYTWHDVLGFT